eukprot:TRINITY_DN29570_c0_g1_i2.p1 TRINITY_DN29570_c0_g1~~TRINITY_DN29570_c0_g1_i2.p1  ORF type:complete len:226 (+),score=62.83 TRINITY_DN29570_c0_g1_i2:33-710(+)
MGGGKGRKGSFGGGGFKGGGCRGGSFKGGGFNGAGAPNQYVVEAPPLYPKSGIQDLHKASEIISNGQDEDLITNNRRLAGQGSWRMSPYFISQVDPRQRFRMRSAAHDADDKMTEILKAGGMRPEFFPLELRTRNVLRIRGNLSEKNVFEVLQRIQDKENNRQEGKDQSAKAKDREGDGPAEEDNDIDDDIFGDEDDLAGYADFEDGMGNDFEDDGGGRDGEADF